MATNRTVQTTLQWVVDQNSIAQVQNANDVVASGLQEVADQAKSVAQQMADAGASAQQIFDATGETINTNLTDPMDKFDDSLNQVIRDIGDLDTAVSSLPMRDSSGRFVSFPDPSLAAFGIDDSGGDSGVDGGGSDSGGGGFSLPSSRAFSAAGRLLGSQAGGQDISEIGSVVRLTAAFGPFGLALGAGLVAVNAITQAEQARAKAAQDGADAINSIAGGAAGGTTESINKQIQQQQQTQSVLADTGKQLAFFQSEVQATQDSYKSGTISVDEYNSVLKDVGEQVSALTGGTIDAGTAVSTLNEIIGDNTKDSDAATVKIGQLNAELTTASVAANDAASALAAQTKTQEDAVNLSLQVDQMTKAQRDQKAAQDLRDLDLINQQIQAGGLTQQATDDLIAKETGLQDETIALSKATNTLADQQAAAAAAEKARTDTTNNYLSAVTAENDAIQKVSQAQQAVSDAAQANNTAIAQIQTNAQAKEAQDRATAYQQSEDDQAKHLQRINQIDAQYDSDHEADVGNRDALKNYQDKQKADQSVANENATYNLQEQQQAQHLATLLQNEQVSERQQEASQNASYAKQNQQLVQNLNAAQVDENRAANEALGYQRQAHDAQLNEAYGFYNDLVSMAQYYLPTAEQIVGNFFANILNHANTLNSPPGSPSASTIHPGFIDAVDQRINTFAQRAFG